MKVSDYLPKLYNNNIEMQNIILSDEKEFEKKLKIYIDNAFKDNFAKVATENGIENFEKLLSISVDENSDNLEYRRAKILTILTTTIPLTQRWLQNSLTELLGKDNFTLNVNSETYTIIINVSNIYKNTTTIVYNFYRPLVPANMVFNVNTFEIETAQLHFGTIMHEGEKILIKVEE